MKKFVLCISLLSAVFCTPTIAQSDEPYNILKIEGMVPEINGQTIYYIKNVGTGLHISYGGEYGKHCKESRAAHPFVLTSNSDGSVALGSLAGYLESNTLWMDWAQTASKWILQPVGGEYVNQYYLVGDNGFALTSVGNSAGLLNMTTLDYKASQRWIFLTESEIRNNRMPKATAEKPFDVTPLIKGAAFDLVDGEAVGANPDQPYEPEALKSLRPYLSKYWSGYDGFVSGYWPSGNDAYDPNLYNYCGIINGEASAYEVTYQVTLPAGTYSYSFEGFYEYVKKTILGTISAYDGKMNATVKVAGDDPITLERYGSKDIYNNGGTAAGVFRDNDNYKHRSTFTLTTEQTISIVISKGATEGKSWTSTTYPNQIFIDNFTLLYFGNGEEVNEEEVNDEALFDSYLDANIDEFIQSLPEEEQEAAKEALENLDRDNINSTEDYYGALEELENLETKVEEEKKQESLGGVITDEEGNIVDKEGNVVEDNSADLPGVIKNPSFEKGTLTGWTMTSGETSINGVRENKGDLSTEGGAGNRLFHAQLGAHLTQTITGLPKGIYKMTASLASDAGSVIVLTGNNNAHEVIMTAGANTFEDFNVKFRVGDDGTATVGVESANGYKADNFRLELLNGDHLVLSENDKAVQKNGESLTLDHWYARLTLERTIKANGNWNTFVIPFDIPANELGDWEVKELTGSDRNGDAITLIFTDAVDGVKAGVPYMVRNKTMTENLTSISRENVTVKTTFDNSSTDDVEFVGVYTAGYIPQGAFFISGNKFWYATDETNSIKGFRAYMWPTVTSARAMGYRFGGEEGTTAIGNGQLTNDNEVTVVAIYTLGGVRINEMQEGVNILKMSDGSTVKVVIK